MATRTVVFDMDGTLVQTRAASWEVFQDTAHRFELPIRSAEEFFELFRGNFYDSLETLCANPDVAAAVRQHFLQALRDRYSPRFVPGMRDVVKALAAHYPLAVMSSNAMGAIRRILDAEGLAACFAHVFSGEIGASKEEHLRHILAEPSYGNARHCSPSYVEDDHRDASEVVLITDTVGDVREARNCGARAIGVAWGMHGSEALLAAGAEAVAIWPQEILATLLPADRAAPNPSSTGPSSTGPSSTGPSSASGAACRCTQDGTGPSGTGATPAAGWPWPEVLAAGQQRRQRRAGAGRGAAHGTASPPPKQDAELVSALRRISRPAANRAETRPADRA